MRDRCCMGMLLLRLAGVDFALSNKAKRRLADEYDAARDRGEVAGQGKPCKPEGFTTAADIGLSHKEIHEAWVP